MRLAVPRLDRYVLALLFATLVWGVTFPILKIATARLSGVEVSALRFLIAALCMLPFVLRVPRHTWRDGLVLGSLVLVSYVGQAFGLEFISSNRSAFLTSLNVLMVPLLAWGLGARLGWVVFLAAVLACLGIGLMSFDGGAHWLADSTTVLGALAYAGYVLLLSGRAQSHVPHQLATAQMFCMALLGGLWMLADSGMAGLQTLPQRLDPQIVGGLLYLGVVASAGMFFLQAVAQRHVSAEKAAVIYAMEPVFAALFGWLWLAEVLTPRAAIGALIVVFAVVLSEMKPASQPD
ncbi:MAG: DMT family transporter [Rhodoferax sp.]|nr:DMT family transporter [Rhodoferax sp.]